jgi:hypothetical protein
MGESTLFDRASASARRAAVTRANAHLRHTIADDAKRKLYADQRDRYADACATAARLRAEWEGLGSPALIVGVRDQETPHPLVKMIAEAEREAQRYAVALGLDLSPAKSAARPAGGRPKGSTSAPDRPSTAEPTRLRAVR